MDKKELERNRRTQVGRCMRHNILQLNQHFGNINDQSQNQENEVTETALTQPVRLIYETMLGHIQSQVEIP